MNHTITHVQLFFMTANFTIGSSLLLAPLITGAVAYEDAWISMILAIIVGVVLQLFLLLLLKKIDYISIFEVTDLAFGKWIGTIVNLIVILYAFHLCALVVGNTDDFMIVIKPDTAPYFYQILMIALAMYTAFSGLQTFGKANETMSVLFYFVFVLSFLLLVPNVEFQNYKPTLYRGWMPVLQGGYNSLGVPFLELTLLTAVLTFVVDKQKVKAFFLNGLLFGGAILFIFVAAAIGVEGAFMVQRETYPTYALMRDIHATVVFQRVEIIIGIVWIFVLFAKMTTLFIIILLGIQHIGRSHSYNAYILPISIGVWTLTNQTHENVIENADFTAKNWTLYSFSIYVIVLVSIVIGIFRDKRNNSS
ncbi:endospore germination permease [Pontibacillus salicampi]|uniref:Endospore germination permease n=1 Tax=Pontibacillus salicampi TaxID=1449801 RepID=A0ABV6LQP1_9BACI